MRTPATSAPPPTAATNRYRYYVCWSRVRYGTKAGCDIHRFNADELEAADQRRPDRLLHRPTRPHRRAVAESQTLHAAATSGRRDELAAVEKELADNKAALDRYLTAFEKGTLDDEDDEVRARLSHLKDRARQLRGRRAQIRADLEQPPEAPTPVQPDQVRRRIREVITKGEIKTKKALFEPLIDRIEIHSDDSLTPIFRVPVGSNEKEPDLDGPVPDQSAAEDEVRLLPTMVGDTGFEPVTSSVSNRSSSMRNLHRWLFTLVRVLVVLALPRWVCLRLSRSSPQILPKIVDAVTSPARRWIEWASRRAGFARSGRVDLVQVEGATGRTTWTRSTRSGCLWCASGALRAGALWWSDSPPQNVIPRPRKAKRLDNRY